MSETETRQALRIVISGRVQGVAFRYFTQRQARQLALAGWVKNLPSGEVEVRVMGLPSNLEVLRQQLRQGPPGSRVDSLSESELRATEEWTDFQIVY